MRSAIRRASSQRVAEALGSSELGPDTYVNVMPQYYPAGKVSAKEHAEINRCITHEEFQEALETASEAGLRRLDNRSVLHAVMR